MADKVFAHINSLKGEMKEVTLLGPCYKNEQPENNFFVFEVGNKLCIGLYNWYVCQFYVDDVYAVLPKDSENYIRYKSHLGYEKDG